MSPRIVACLLLGSAIAGACGNDAPPLASTPAPDPARPLDGGSDAGAPVDASIQDAAADADAAPAPTSCLIDGVTLDANAVDPANECRQCRPDLSTTAWSSRGAVPVFTGGVAPASQGWSVLSGPPATLTEGADYLRLATSTSGNVSGWQLLYRAGVVPTDRPFAVRVELRIESVDRHNALDSAAALLGSYTPDHGTQLERAAMVYLDADGVGWGDDYSSASVAMANGAYHTVELAVDADRKATVRVDGAVKVTRPGFVTNGTIAVGDQTNDKGFDSAIRIRSIAKVCL